MPLTLQEPEHITMIRDSVRRLLAKQFPIESAAQWDKDDRIPREVMQPFIDLGVYAMAVPEEYGGLGVDFRAVMAVIEELATRSAILSGLYIQTAIYGSFNVLAAGSEGQKRALLPRLANGELLFAYGLSEPNVGADLASVQTRAVRRGDRVIVNGAKRWCSGADIADYIYALVRSGGPEERRNNLSLLLIPPKAKGISITTTSTMGMRGVSTCDVNFDEVELPFEETVVGGEAGWNQGWSLLAGPTLEAEKVQVPAMAVGIGQAALDEAWGYAQERRQFGVRICAHQSVRHLLVEAKTKLMACRLMLDRCTDLVASNLPSAVETSMAKLFVAETVREIVLDCQRVLGAYGYAEGFQMERLVRDVLVLPIWGGSSAIQKNNLANLLKLPRD